MTSLMTLNNTKVENYVIIASLKSKTIGKLIKTDKTSLVSFDKKLPAIAFRAHVESLRKPRYVNKGS